MWLGNSRGSKYGRTHSRLDPDNPEDMKQFWEFSFVELGEFDLKTQIDHVLNQTNQEKLTYIGHSQGTTQMFYGLSMYPEYFKQRINLFVALAPVVKLGTNKSARFKVVSFLGNSFVNLFAKRGVYEAFGKGWDKEYGYIRKIVPAANNVIVRTDMINYDLDSNERTKMLMGHFPHGTSTRSLNHFG